MVDILITQQKQGLEALGIAAENATLWGDRHGAK